MIGETGMKIADIKNALKIEEPENTNNQQDEETKRKNTRLMMLSMVSISTLWGIASGHILIGALFGFAILLGVSVDFFKDEMNKKK